MDPATVLRGLPSERLQPPRRRAPRRLKGPYRKAVKFRDGTKPTYGITVGEFLARKRHEASLVERSWSEPARTYQQIAHDALARPGAEHGGAGW